MLHTYYSRKAKWIRIGHRNKKKELLSMYYRYLYIPTCVTKSRFQSIYMYRQDSFSLYIHTVKHLSIVIPAYNEYLLLPNTIASIQQKMVEIGGYTYEIVVVNDGSTDATRHTISQLAQKYSEIVGVNFSRNFWKEIALSAGLKYASWDAVITYDADGQYPIDKLPDFIEARESWYKIVYNKRPKTVWVWWIKRVTSRGFYKFFNLISDFKLESQTTDYRLLDRHVVDIFLQFNEKNRMYRGIIDLIWFNKKALIFDALPNPEGRKPSYNYSKLIQLALDSITSFSVWPLKLVAMMGTLITTLSCIWLCTIFVMIVFMNNPRGITNLWTFTLINTFFMWILMMSMGLIAIYIANIHAEVQNRPLYIVQDVIGLDG